MRSYTSKWGGLPGKYTMMTDLYDDPMICRASTRKICGSDRPLNTPPPIPSPLILRKLRWVTESQNRADLLPKSGQHGEIPCRPGCGVETYIGDKRRDWIKLSFVGLERASVNMPTEIRIGCRYASVNRSSDLPTGTAARCRSSCHRAVHAAIPPSSGLSGHRLETFGNSRGRTCPRTIRTHCRACREGQSR